VRGKRPPIFEGYCRENGVRRRLRQVELRECWRLWCKHADIRTGRLKA
jgi:hypothetical protein